MPEEQEQPRSLIVRMKIEFGYESVTQLKKDFDELSSKDKQDLNLKVCHNKKMSLILTTSIDSMGKNWSDFMTFLTKILVSLKNIH